MSEEELGCGIDREASGQVLEIDGLAGLEVRDVVEGPVSVFVEEPEVGCPVVGKEWSSGRAVLQEGKRHEKRGACISYRLPHFVIPV